MSDTIIWITGANYGIGAGLAKYAPHKGARIINVSNMQHPDYETVLFDLTEPATWDTVTAHFQKELAAFKGKRAIFLQNAHFAKDMGLVGEVEPQLYLKGILANAVAPIYLADGFLRACRPEFESGIMLMSSHAAAGPMPGLATYGAGKLGIEHWVKTVQAERKLRGTGPWIVAMRPGFVDTPTTRETAEYGTKVYPRADKMKEALQSGNAQDPETTARAIWSFLPPPPDTHLIDASTSPLFDPKMSAAIRNSRKG